MVKSNVLVTGGAGFIGSHVAKILSEKEYGVVVLDDLSGGFQDNVPPSCDFVCGSAGDRDVLRRLFEKYRFRHVFHLAAYAAEGLSHFIRTFNYRNNLLTSVALINECVKNKVDTFVFTSSIAVYGKNQVPMSEEMAPSPEDPYGISKYAVELDLRAAHELFGLKYVIFRPHNVYGSNQNIGDPYRNAIGIFLNQVMQGKPLTIFGDGTQTRAFSHIDDVAPVIARSIEEPKAFNQVFNVGADEPVSVNVLALEVMKAMGKQVPVDHLPARNEVVHAFSSHEKVRRVFGLTNPSKTLSEGIREMAAWALEKGPRQGKPFEEIEIEENLPLSWARLLKKGM